MRTRVVTTRDIRFNNGVKTHAVRMNDKGHYDYGFWCDGKFTKEGEHVTVSQAMLAAGMVQPAIEDRRPAWNR